MYIPSLILILAFVFLTMGPTPLSQKTFMPIHKTITIKTNKSLPPYLAYESIQPKSQLQKSEWDLLEEKPVQVLTLDKRIGVDPRPFAQKLVLHEVVVQKQVQSVRPVQFDSSAVSIENPSIPIVREDDSWKENLTAAQKARVEQAQRAVNGFTATLSRTNVAATQLQRSAASVKPLTPTQPTRSDAAKDDFTLRGETERSLIASHREFDTKALAQEIQVVGHIEIHRGLAVTNEHHIELRRKEEGVLQERGEIDIQKGTYTIRIPELTGSLVAQLVAKGGQVIGEGIVRVSQSVVQNERTVQGPTMRVFPKSEMSGTVISAYKAESAEPAPTETTVKFLNGGAELDIKKDGKVQYDSLARGSSTLLRAESPGFTATQQIVMAGSEFQSVLFPEKMISSFKNIVSEQRQYNYNDPKIPVIWGQVLQDGKPVAGVQISLEGFDSMDVIYFNEFNLPDPNLKATSTQGGFAILDPPLGFQSVLARRGDYYYAHQNTIVDEGVVSLVRIETSLKTENTTVKVYDAFTGQAEASQLNIQGQGEKVFVEDGYYKLLMPQVAQMSLLEATPRAGYLAATYFYNEAQGYIHVPLISESWMSWLTSQQRINQSPGQSLVIGFVPDEDFQVTILTEQSSDQQHIIFFDSRGQIVKSKTGVAGGGFIIFNAPTDAVEVSVQLVKSEKTLSRLIPSKPGQVSVLNYRLE